ncbi:MAG: hypothetical protein K8I03_08160, partial [Ignavibacteria bacterium]|nr:hypothetical protein [Ignavibacteria bacterium]
MKTILKFVFALLFIAGGLQAQVLLYNQNFNDSSGGLPANWTNIGSCNWVKDNTNPSSGYANSSGGRNMWANCNGNSEITVSNIVTTGYASLTVTFGARKGATQLNNLEFYWSSDGSVYNLISFTDVTNNATWTLVNGGVAIILPAGCENQANLRFKFKINNSGSAADYRFDDFRLSGIAPPTKLYITSVIGTGCSFPQVGIPFSVTVQSRDINNNPANVTSATTIQLSSTPSGITGTTSGIIAINTSSVTISGVIYNTAGGITITATPTAGMTGLTPYTTGTINVKALPTGLAFNNLQVTGIVNNVHPSFQVRATPLDSGSACFSGLVTLVQVSGPSGGLTGTLAVNASGGQATFSNVIFTQVGVYQIKATASGLTDAPTTTVTIGTAPVAFTQMIVPLNMQGKSGTNDQRVHSAFLAEITNLVPNQMYRYYTRAVSTTDNVTEVGNSIYAYSGINFVRSTNPNLTTAGSYGLFTSDALGKFRGWFMLEPTGDSRFAAGELIKHRVVVDGGNNGVPTYTFTTAQTTKCLTFGTTPGSLTEGTALSLLSPNAGTQQKNFLLFYRGDTAGTSGRPVAINVIENDGLNLSG